MQTTLHLDPAVTLRHDLDSYALPHPLPRPRVLHFDGAMHPAAARRCPFPASPVAIAEDPAAGNARRQAAKAQHLRNLAEQLQREDTQRQRQTVVVRAAAMDGEQRGYVKGWHQGLRDAILVGVLAGALLVAGALQLGRLVGAL